MRNQAGGNNQQGGRGGRGGGIDFNAMREAMEKLAKDAESDLAKILTADQRKRLAEISLQVEGATAIIDREDIAKKLNITPVQKNKLMQIKQTADQKQQELRTQAMAGFGFGGRGQGAPGGPGGPGGFGGPGGRGQGAPGGNAAPGGRGQGAPGGNGAPQGQANNGGGRGNRSGGAPGGAPGGGNAGPGGQGGPGGPGGRGNAFANMTPEERQKAGEDMRKGFEKMRDDSNKLRDQLEAAIVKSLTKRQQDAWKKMNGEKFDVDTIMSTMQFGQGGRGGPGGRGGATQVD